MSERAGLVSWLDLDAFYFYPFARFAAFSVGGGFHRHLAQLLQHVLAGNDFAKRRAFTVELRGVAQAKEKLASRFFG